MLSIKRKMKLLNNILLWLWQAPQNFIGWFIATLGNLPKRTYNNDIYYIWNFNSVSLGDYRLLHIKSTETTYKHEMGHSIQSKYLGWLYLIVIGLPSVIGNLIWRIPKWSTNHDYYKQPWEAWADKLGGVKR